MNEEQFASFLDDDDPRIVAIGEELCGEPVTLESLLRATNKVGAIMRAELSDEQLADVHRGLVHMRSREKGGPS